MLEYTYMITNFINCVINVVTSWLGEVMRKLVMAEREELHRVWNLVVPANSLCNNNPFKSIPPLTKLSSKKAKRTRVRNLMFEG